MSIRRIHFRNSTRERFLTTAAMAAFSFGMLRADVATLNPTDDVTVFASSKENNAQLKVRNQPASDPNRSRVLLQFDLAPAASGIPAGSTINSVSLKMTMEQAPTKIGNPNDGVVFDRNYDLCHGNTDTWSEGAAGLNLGTVACETVITSIASGTTTGEKEWTGDALKSRFTMEFEGDQTLTLVVKDQAETGNQFRGIFTSKDTATPANFPNLEVDFTPPGDEPCDEATIEITRFDLAGPQPLDFGINGAFEVGFTVTAGCKPLTSIKAQGGFGGNLVVDETSIKTCAGDSPCTTHNGVGVVEVKKPGAPKSKGQNTVFTWTIPALDAGESATINVSIYTTYNFAGNPACGTRFVTGSWKAVGIWDNGGTPTVVESDRTDQLCVDFTCPY